VTLTDSGEAFFQHAQRALTAVQEGTDAIDAVRLGEIGSIRIGSSSSIGAYVLPKHLKEFRSSRPGVHIYLTTGTSEEVIERLLAGELNVAICRLTQHPELESTAIFNDDLTLAVPPGHPFAERDSVKMSEAGQEPFLFFERSSSYHTLIYNVFLRLGIVPESVMELDSIETTKHMIEAGLGVAILPISNMERDVATGHLATVEITDLEQPPQREVGLRLSRRRSRIKPLFEFVRIVLDAHGVELAAEDEETGEGSES